MKKFQVEITEILQKTIEVEAEDKRQAIIIAKSQYHKEDITLKEINLMTTEFEVREDL